MTRASLQLGVAVMLAASATACTDKTIPIGVSVLYALDIATLTQEPLVQGRDGGYSAIIGGRSTWTFGDTYLSSPAVDGKQTRGSTFGITTDVDASNGIDYLQEPIDANGAPAEFLPFTADEQAFNDQHAAASDGTCAAGNDCGRRWALWPGPMVVNSDGNLATMFYNKVDVSSAADTSAGAGIATWDGVNPPVRTTIDTTAADPFQLFAADPFDRVSAALTVGDTTYAYFCSLDFVIFVCRVGRAPTVSVAMPSAWTYFDGANWQSSFAAGKRILQGAPTMSVHFNAYLNKYLAVYSTPVADSMQLVAADAPEGPWSSSLTFVYGKKPLASGINDYSGMAHPEFSTGGGNVDYVTYYRPGDFVGEMHLVEVTYQ